MSIRVIDERVMAPPVTPGVVIVINVLKVRVFPVPTLYTLTVKLLPILAVSATGAVPALNVPEDKEVPPEVTALT